MVENEPKYQIRWTSQYKKDIKLAKKRNYNISELLEVVKKLSFYGALWRGTLKSPTWAKYLHKIRPCKKKINILNLYYEIVKKKNSRNEVK